MEENKKQSSRRKFLQQTTLAGAGVMFASPLQLFSQTNKSKNLSNNIKSRGYAGKDEQGKLELWPYVDARMRRRKRAWASCAM